MIRGIGIDTAAISEMARICAHPDDAFVRRMFTDAERAQAAARTCPAEYLAGRFAAKEAVFKALAHLTRNGFDLSAVETIDDADGCPTIHPSDVLRRAMDEAGVTSVLVSITNENDTATAIALVQ